ncbi:MAG: response regulator [Alphaproteobacteria bacterium]|nr:response regulator [Alphaproteobacteria bacterium]
MFGAKARTGPRQIRAAMTYRFDRLKILVVDDNPHMRKLLAAILQAAGVTQLFQAESVATAWAAFNEANPDIVFVDWMLNGPSGLELVRMIRTDAKSANPLVPVIMLTGYTQIEHVIQARDAGATEFLAKPVSAKSILARLVAVIEYPRAFVRTKYYFGPCRRRHRPGDYRGQERRSAGSEVAIDMPSKP